MILLSISIQLDWNKFLPLTSPSQYKYINNINEMRADVHKAKVYINYI